MKSSIPSDQSCMEILEEHHVPKDILTHTMIVTEIVDEYGEKLCQAGYLIDKKLLHAASLLHDIAKGQEPHALIGAKWIEELGYPQVAALIREHTDLSEDGFENIDGRAILYLCDKMELGDKRASLEERFAVSFRRYEDNPVLLSDMKERYARAVQIRKKLEKIIGKANTEK